MVVVSSLLTSVACSREGLLSQRCVKVQLETMQLNFLSTKQDGFMSRKSEKLLPDMSQNHARKSVNSAGLCLDLCPGLQ